jgi:hypothetical protein
MAIIGAISIDPVLSEPSKVVTINKTLNEAVRDKILKVFAKPGTFTDSQSQLKYTVSFDGGLTFAKSANLSNAGGIPFMITNVQNNAYVVWSYDNDNRSTKEIFFTKSSDNGKTFSKPINLSNDSLDFYVSSIIASENNVNVLWESMDWNSYYSDVIYTRSIDNGENFSKPIKLNNITQLYPELSSMAVFGNKVHAIWENQYYDNRGEILSDILYTNSDNGKTFSKPIKLSNDLESMAPYSIISRNNVYVLWNNYDAEKDTRDIFYTMSSDNGKTFSKPINLSKDAPDAWHPSIATSGNNVFIIWTQNDAITDRFSTLGQIFYTMSSDNGKTFSNPTKLSTIDTKKSSFRPSIAAYGNNVYVLWNNYDAEKDTSDIFYTKSSDNGENFSKPIKLNNNNQSSNCGAFPHSVIVSCPSIVTSGNSVYILWKGLDANGEKIFYTMSNNNGKTFNNIINLNNSINVNSFNLLKFSSAPSLSISPDPLISVSGNNVFVVWNEVFKNIEDLQEIGQIILK